MRRLAFLGLVLVAAILSCKDLTAPGGGRFARGLSWNAIFPPPLRDIGGASSGVVDFSKVHVVLHHSDGTVALDTTIDFPSGADSLTVSLAVRLLNNAPASGEPMSLDLGYVNAAGDTVFKGGPISLTAAPPPAGGGVNPPVQVPVAYTGPGASATTVVAAPRSVTVGAGAPFTFTAVAKDAGGNPLTGTPVIWTSLDPTIATITAPAAGTGVAQNLRGTARILAQLLTGAMDTVQVIVTLPASQVAKPASASGDAQTGAAGAPLAQPIVAKVTASDGVAVAGTTVTFAVTTGGGAVSPLTAISDANGLAQTTWTLGPAAGAQSITAAAATLTGSPLTYTATATAAAAAKLVVTTQPVNGSGGAILPAIVVSAEDANGNVATNFTGAVTVALGATPSGATLGGTLSVNAVAGVATFSTLTINKAFTGYTLVGSASGLTAATSNAFNIAVGAASTLVSAGGGGQTGTVNGPLPASIAVRATDAGGNGVAGKTVTFATTNGSVSPTSAVTDVNGLASTTWTLGPTAGAQSMTAAAAGLANSPLAITATGAAVAATKLVFTAAPVSTTGGATLAAVAVSAEDASGNLATTFTGAVTLALDNTTSGATLGGTLSVNAVGGVATFSTLTVDKAFTGYTLMATATGPSSAMSSAFDITIGPAAIIVSAGGNAQTGTINLPLPTPIAVRVTDAGGNGVAGKTVTFSAVNGSDSPTSAVSDASGLAVTTWTLGAPVGAQSMTATSAGLTNSPLTIVATGTTVGSGPAVSLSFSTQPSAAAAGAVNTPAIVVHALDVNNMLATSFTGNVTLAIGTNTGTSTLGGTLTVAAVAGVATFPNITLNKVGTGYTLIASSGTLTAGTSSAFTITPGPAATLALVSGSGQTGTAGVALGTALTVLVADASGNAVPGASVTFAIASGNGSLGTTTTMTNASGQATSVWTLGLVVGAQSVTATSGTLAGSPVTFTATAMAGTAASLSFGTQPSNAVAGVANAPAIVVRALDANGLLMPGYPGTVTLAIAANPGGSTLGGSVAIAPVGGVATFSNVILNKVGTGYTLTASSGSLTAATSSAFNIAAAPASVLAAFSGGGQSGQTGLALAAPLVVKVTDAFVNVVAGQSVTFAITTGGGLLGTTTTTTDATGQASSVWTLGATIGTQSVTVSSSGLTSVVFTASGLAATRIWTGANGNAWTMASNWSPAIVPAATDSVFIPSTAMPPTLSSNVIVRALVTSPGGQVIIPVGDTLTDIGALDASGGVIGGGTVVLAGTGTVTGGVTGALNVTGHYALTGTTVVTGNVTVSSGGIVFNGNSMAVTGLFCTSGTGTVTMASSSEFLNVTGDVKFNGGSTAGLITGGRIQVTGNFIQMGAPNTFAPSGTNTVAFVGSVPQTVIIANPGAATFQNFTSNNNTEPVEIEAAITIQGNTLIGGPVYASAPLTINGTLSDPTVELFAVGGLTLGNATVPLSWATPAILSDVTFTGSSAALQGPLEAFGAVTIAAGSFALNGQPFFVDSTFTTTGTGTLVMNNAADSMLVAKQATFSGGAEAGLLTNGTLGILQGLVASGPGQFAASGNHVTYFAGPLSVGCDCTLAQLGMKPQRASSAAPPTSAAPRTGAAALMSSATSGGAKPSPAALAAQRAAGRARAAGAKALIAGMRAARKALAAKWPSRAASVRAARAAGGAGAAGAAARTRRISFRTAAPSQAGPAGVTAVLAAARAGFTAHGGGFAAPRTAASATPFGGAPRGAAPMGPPIVRSGAGGFTIPFYSDSAVYVAFADTTGNHFANVRVTGTTDWQTFAYAAGNVLVDTTGTVEGNGHLSIGDTLFVSGSGDVEPAAVELFGVMSDTGYFSPDTALYSGASQTLQSNSFGDVEYNNVIVSSPSLNALAEDGYDIDIGGSLFIVNSGQLRIGTPVPSNACNGCESDFVRVYGSFETHDQATLRMTDTTSYPYLQGSLQVMDSAYFAGGSTAGIITAGEIDFYGNFRQSGSASAYTATSPHQSYFGSSAQSIVFANPGYTSSHFGDWWVDSGLLTMNSSAFLDGLLLHYCYSDCTGVVLHAGVPGVQVTSRGADVRNSYEFDGVTWDLQDNYPVYNANWIDFENQDPATIQFSIERTDSLALPESFDSWTFGTRPTPLGPGLYVQVTQTDNQTTGVLTATFTNLNLEGNFGFALAINNAVLNWNNGGGDNALSSATKWIGAGLGVGSTSPPRTGALNNDTSRSAAPLRALRF